MSRQLSIPVVAALLSLNPALLLAGGPPRLCLPVDGVNADSAAACSQRLARALGEKVGRVETCRNEEQWYAMLFLSEDVKLSEVEAAFKGSPFSVARDRLRLFGHVILEVEQHAPTADGFLGELAAIEHVAVSEARRDESTLHVTLDMPYPRHFGRQIGDFGTISVQKETFTRLHSPPETTIESERPATARTLPSYATLRDLLAKREVRLKDIRWSVQYSCRTVGGLAVLEKDPA